MDLIIKITGRLHRFAKNDCVGTLAELAILIPFLVVMLAAVTELGRFFQAYTTVSKATRSAARYLSNHPFTDAEKDKAKNLVVCGKLTECADNERLVRGIEKEMVCIESTGAPVVETVTVRIGGCADPLVFEPIFNIGALLHNSFSMDFPIRPGTTMYHKSG